MVKKEFVGYTKYIGIFYVFAVLVVSFYLSDILSALFQKMRWEDIQVVGDQLPLSTLIAAIISISIALFIWFNKKYNTASYETADELFKVDWPNGEEAKNSTLITIVVSVVLSIMLALVDMLWSALTTWLI
jgi:preprotein translocase subunit SecE